MVEVALVSHPGRVRADNEDYAYHGETPHGYVGIVCDGMGGEAAGEVAARIAADAAFQYLLTPSSSPPEQLLKEAIQTAQNHLLHTANRHPQYQNFGTTIAIALIKGNTLYYAHVGDSRIYLLRRNTLTLLTEDDSLVHQMLKEGLITPDQALQHPQKHILSQCLGPRQQPEPHIGQTRLRPADVVLLCTDGLSNLLSQEEILSQVSRSSTLPEAAENLVSQANRQGGYDNITVLLLRPPTKSPTFVIPMKLPPTKYLIAGGIGLVVVILLAVVFSRSGSPAPADSDGVIMITDSSDTQSDLSMPSPSDTYENPPSTSDAASSPIPTPEAAESSTPATETPQPPAEPNLSPSKISSPAKGASPKTPSTPPARTSTIEITVQKGDNLTQIAKIFHTTRASIQRANDLQSENIRAGQKLAIPVKAVKSHTVQKGETLSKLARTYRSSIEAIRRANGLSDKDEIKVGQKLKIPVLE